MPRRDYLKHFARNGDGDYIGTERERRWSEQELENAFGAYRLRQPRKWVLCNENGQRFMEEETSGKHN